MQEGNVVSSSGPSGIGDRGGGPKPGGVQLGGKKGHKRQREITTSVFFFFWCNFFYSHFLPVWENWISNSPSFSLFCTADRPRVEIAANFLCWAISPPGPFPPAHFACLLGRLFSPTAKFKDHRPTSLHGGRRREIPRNIRVSRAAKR